MFKRIEVFLIIITLGLYLYLNTSIFIIDDTYYVKGTGWPDAAVDTCCVVLQGFWTNSAARDTLRVPMTNENRHLIKGTQYPLRDILNGKYETQLLIFHNGHIYDKNLHRLR